MPPKRVRKPTAKAAAAKKASSRPFDVLDGGFEIPSPPTRPILTPPPSAQQTAPETAPETVLETLDSQATQTPTQQLLYGLLDDNDDDRCDGDLDPLSTPPRPRSPAARALPTAPPAYNIEWQAWAGKLRVASDNTKRADFSVMAYISHAVIQANKQLAVKKQKVTAESAVARATIQRRGDNWVQDLSSNADISKVDNEVWAQKKTDITVKIRLDLVVEEEVADAGNSDVSWAGNEAVLTQSIAATPASQATAPITATAYQRSQLPARIQAQIDAGTPSTALIAASNRCSKKDCPNAGKPCYLIEDVHIPIDANLLRKWADRVHEGKATLTDPGADFIQPYIKAQIRLAELRNARQKRGTKRHAESPHKSRDPARGIPLIQNFHMTPTGPQPMAPPAWPTPFSYGYSPWFPPPIGQPGSGYGGGEDRHSSPPTIDGEDDDQLLRDYFTWMKRQRPSKVSQLNKILEELEEQSYGYSQLTIVPAKAWDEIDAPAGLKALVLGQRKSFQKYQRRTAEAQKARRDEMIEISSGGASE